MSTLLVILLPDGRSLGLTPEAFADALAAGDAAMPKANTDSAPQAFSDELLTAAQIAAKTNVDASWFLEQARLDRIPFASFGKYRRFSLRAVTAHLARSTDTRTADTTVGRKPLIGKQL